MPGSEQVVLLNAKKQLILDVLHRIETEKLEPSEAALVLGISIRTLRRYRKRYRETGVRFLRHGNQGRSPVNRLSSEFKERVQSLIRERYFDFNMLHCRERLLRDHGIDVKRETLRKWCHEIGHVKRPKRKRARARFRRDRMERPGLLLQMDGSHHAWFGNVKTCLIAVIDDATSEVLHAEIFPSESTLSCMQVLRKLIERRGVFSLLYADRAGVYGGIKRSGFSQVERALGELGANVVYAYSPEAKGRIERLFSTLQDRLIPELRLHGASTLAQANRYLQQDFLPEHNRRFSVVPANEISAFRPLPVRADLEQIFSVKEYRSIARDHTFAFRGERYRFVSFLRHSLYRQRVEIRTYTDGSWKVFWRGREVNVGRIRLERKTA